MTIYKYNHKSEKYYFFAPRMSGCERSKWKLKRACQVNPHVMGQMRIFVSLTINNENYNNQLNLSNHIREFMNRMNTGLLKGIRVNMLNIKTGLTKVIKVKLNKRLKYIAVIERGGKNNRLHVHFLINQNYIPVKYILKCWKIGIQNAVKRIKNSKMALKYLTKYMTKDSKRELNESEPKVNRWIFKSWSFPFEYVVGFSIEKNDHNEPIIWDESEEYKQWMIEVHERKVFPLFRRLKLKKYVSDEAKYVHKLMQQEYLKGNFSELTRLADWFRIYAGFSYNEKYLIKNNNKKLYIIQTRLF